MLQRSRCRYRQVALHAEWVRAASLAVMILTLAAPARADDPDRDGDGLSDFQETHKYFTDPTRRDSDGDGKPDGDWDERREYAYTVRSVLRVLLPVNERAIANDDYQDARVLARTDRFVDLEVIHYPLNTVAAGITANRSWKEDYGSMHEDLRAGLTTNWDDAMRRQLLRDLAADGIHVDRLTDRQVVERASAWLLKRVKSGRYFNIFHVHFPAGKPEVYPGQEGSVGDRGDPRWTLQEQWDHELFGRQMYQNRACGTCTSTAVLTTTVLRALGVPTRMVLCTPLVDASGGDNLDLVRNGLTHHAVRATVVSSLERLKNSNASHTFCEVFVGGRWRRLNFAVLGQGILDANLFGLLTHVHTFPDLADANLAATWGARKPDAVFRYANAYTALQVSDRFGAHGRIPNPQFDPDRPLSHLVVGKAYWLEAEDLPDCIDRAKFRRDGSGHLFLHAERPFFGERPEHYKAFYDGVTKSFTLTAPGHPDVRAAAERGYWLNPGLDYREFYVRVPPAEMKKLKPGVAYRLQSGGDGNSAGWTIASEVRVIRP
jgi:hypothetical protein